MKKEIEQLKSTITQKDVKIRQLEAQLEQMNLNKWTEWILKAKKTKKKIKIKLKKKKKN